MSIPLNSRGAAGGCSSATGLPRFVGGIGGCICPSWRFFGLGCSVSLFKGSGEAEVWDYGLLYIFTSPCGSVRF